MHLKRPIFISKVFGKLLAFFLIMVVGNTYTPIMAQAIIMSPKPPPPALSTSLAPQPAPLPPAPGKLPLKQGYFPGEDGVQLFYRMVGSGKDTIVFIHGGPGVGIDDGGLDLEVLASKGYTFIQYDQRGGARSELVRDTTKLVMNNHVMDLEALRQYFKLPKLTLIGLSWGAAIITYYADRFPHRVSRMVFLSPMPPTLEFANQRTAAVNAELGAAKKKRIEELFSQMDSADNKDLPALWSKFYAIYLPIYITNPDHRLRERGNPLSYSPLAFRNKDYHSIRRYLRPWDFRPQLKRIKVPSVVIEGEKTKIPLAATRAYVEDIKGAKLILIPNAGHQNWLDQPKKVQKALHTFFKSTRPY
jgi:proline iminopeptidase